MTHPRHPAIAAHEKIMSAFSALHHHCTNEGGSADKVISIAHEVGYLIKKSRDHGYDAVVRQAAQQAQRLYIEAAIHKDFCFDDEEWSAIRETFAFNLPVPDHQAVRFYVTASPRALRQAVETFCQTTNVFENFTLKQDAYSLCKYMGEQGRNHGEAAQLFIRYLADVSRSSSQVFPETNVVYAIAAYFGGLKEQPDIDAKHNIGLVLHEFIDSIESAHSSFDKAKVEDAIALHRYGYPKIAERVALKCFPNSHSLQSTALLHLEREIRMDVSPLVSGIIGTSPMSEEHLLHTGLLVMHFLAARKPVMTFEDLHLTTSKAAAKLPEWIETSLVEYRDSLNEEHLKTLITFIVDQKPQMLKRLKAHAPIREFLKTMDVHGADLLAEDLGL